MKEEGITWEDVDKKFMVKEFLERHQNTQSQSNYEIISDKSSPISKKDTETNSNECEIISSEFTFNSFEKHKRQKI